MRTIMMVDSRAGGAPTDCVIDDSITTWGEFLDKYPQYANTKAVMGTQWTTGTDKWVLKTSDVLPNGDGIMIYLVEDKHKGAI